MNKVVLMDIFEKLSKDGMHLVNIEKDKRGPFYRLVMKITGRPTKNINLLRIESDSSTKRLVFGMKSDAKEEYENLYELENKVAADFSLGYPKPYILLEDKNTIAVEYIEGKTLSELLVFHHFFLGTSKKELNKAFEHLGKSLAEFHSKTVEGEMDIIESVKRRVDSVSDMISDKLAERIKKLPDRQVLSPETYIHDDLHLRNIMYGEGKVSLIDWPKLKYGCPLHDVHFFRRVLRRRNKTYLRRNLNKLGTRFVKSYIQTADFDISQNLFHLSNIDFWLRRKGAKPDSTNDRFMTSELENSLEKINKK